jgi:hypothetical protein
VPLSSRLTWKDCAPARDAVMDRSCRTRGAGDTIYVTKPFSFEESPVSYFFLLVLGASDFNGSGNTSESPP